MPVYRRSITTERETGTTLYLASPVDGPVRHGYLLREDLIPELSDEHSAPDSLELKQTWQGAYPGVYLFFPDLPLGDNARKGFVTAVSNYLKHQDRAEVRFAWFADPDKWETGLSAPLELRLSAGGTPGKATNPQQVNFSADKFSLRITRNNRIYPVANDNAFLFDSTAYANSFGSARRTKIENGLELLLDNGPQQGCFRFPLNVTGKELDALNVALDFFYATRGWGPSKLNYSVFDVKEQNVVWPMQAVFDPLDLLNEGLLQDTKIAEKFTELRTGFAFAAMDQVSAIPPLATHYRTRYGKQIELSPAKTGDGAQGNSVKQALLTFSRTHTENASLSMVLQGDFHLGVIEAQAGSASQAHHFLCGLSGTETISFRAAAEDYPGDIMRFHPRKPAYSSRFPVIGETREKVEVANDLLEDKLTTSWVSIHPCASAIDTRENFYYSQPQDSPLFKAAVDSANAGTSDQDEVVFDVFDAPSANLAHSDINIDCFPMVPVAAAPLAGGSKKKKSMRLEFETQIINPSRKLTIDRFTTRARPLFAQAQKDDSAPGNIELTTSPQGFLVAFDKTDVSKKWQSLILANEQASGRPPLQLKLLPPYVQSAFQTNEQFLVISNPDRETLDYLKHQFQDQINIAAWPFILDVVGKITHSNTSTRYRNILIFKFCKHSLVERLKNPELWTQAQSFNQSFQLQDLSRWALEYIERSRLDREQLSKNQNGAQGKHDTSIMGQGYDEFLQKVNDPDWNGIMALQVTLDLAQLPEAIKSIVAGIDIRRFAAHHVAINSNQILSKKGRLDRDFKSSMFGLISYFDQDLQKQQSAPNSKNTILPQVTGDYDFKVLELQVLFRHSEISDFNCKIQLSANTLFNEPVIAESTAPAGAVNKFSIVLEGLYDKHDGQTSYSFRQLSDNSLELNSTAVNKVNVHSVQLSTVHEKQLTENKNTASGNGEAGQVTTRFALSGHMVMQELEDLDMLSYERISFSALYIEMSFDVNAPQRSKRFRFIPANILLDPGESKLRNDSLVAHFPITLQSLEYYSPDASSASTSARVSPSTLGFQKVEAPMNYNAIQDSWYALQFNLNLGSMGSLAAKGGFEATMLLSWSPGIKNKAAQIWIRTPFSGGGGKQFSIQGVLKLVTQSIRLEKKPGKPEFAMLFTNVKVSLLGLKLPPSGNTLLYLFGNPDEISSGDVSGTGNLGWFGAYKKTEEKAQKSKKTKQLPGTT